MIIRVFLYWNWKEKKGQAVFTNNHMNIDKKNHPQLLRQEQPFMWPMVIQIGLGKGMYVSTFSVLFRFGIFVSLICIPFQFLCTFHFVSFRYISLRFISFRFVLVNFVPFRYISFPVSFRILQVPQFTRVQTPEAFDTISIYKKSTLCLSVRKMSMCDIIYYSTHWHLFSTDLNFLVSSAWVHKKCKCTDHESGVHLLKLTWIDTIFTNKN